MTAPLSPIAAAQAELAADTAVLAIVGTDGSGAVRVRTVEPQPGDALGPGKYLPFVVVSVLDDAWTPTTATGSATVGIRAYAATHSLAEALCLACLAVFNRRGPRIASSRLGIYGSTAHGGPTLDKDPDTSQPVAYGLVTLNHSTQPTP